LNLRLHLRILCVDDNDAVLATLKLAFTRAGFEVETAYNGYNALTKLTKKPHSFQVILTDIRMPGIDGFGLIEKSRLAGYTGAIIIYAASITPDARQRLEELKVNYIIEKPVQSAELIAAVRNSLSAVGRPG
jgi:CheY-like chemotaxis protein